MHRSEMIVAHSRFRVRNALEAQVAQAFIDRPRRVEQVPGFLGLEVFRSVDDPATFHLFTRWTNREHFEAWHKSPAHGAAHELMPPGLKLDPAHTQLIVAERVEGASSEELVPEFAPVFGAMTRESDGLHFARVDAEGRVVTANAAMRHLLGDRDSLAQCLNEASRADLTRAREARQGGPLSLQLTTPEAEPVSLRCWFSNLPDGFVLLAEPSWREQRQLERLLHELNNELATLQREAARQRAELEQSYWQMRKISEVLPICLRCHKVKDGASWEEASHFLSKYSRFLSHGYCEPCGEAVMAELEAEDAR